MNSTLQLILALCGLFAVVCVGVWLLDRKRDDSTDQDEDGGHW